MKCRGLDGREYHIEEKRYKSQGDDLNKSSLHLLARKLIKSIFPFDVLLEEVPLPSTRLFADFLLPLPRLVIEVHGEQHYKFNKLFHKDSTAFAESVFRDKLKIEWCNHNNIKLIELPYNESEDEWRNRINS